MNIAQPFQPQNPMAAWPLLADRQRISTTELTKPTEGDQLFSVRSVRSVVNIGWRSPLKKLPRRTHGTQNGEAHLCILRGWTGPHGFIRGKYPHGTPQSDISRLTKEPHA